MTRNKVSKSYSMVPLKAQVLPILSIVTGWRHMHVSVSMAIQSGTSVTTQTVGENTSEGDFLL